MRKQDKIIISCLFVQLECSQEFMVSFASTSSVSIIHILLLQLGLGICQVMPGFDRPKSGLRKIFKPEPDL
jgi:hypothetical protein